MLGCEILMINNLETGDTGNGDIIEIIEKHGRMVYRLAYAYLHNQHLADDAYQDVFLRVVRKYNDFRKDSSVETWLTRITINVCKDYLKSAWVKRTVHVDEDRHADSDMEKSLIEEDENKRLYMAVLTLKANFRSVILLYYYSEYDTETIAKILKISAGTVRSRLHRARAQLKKTLKDEIQM